MVTWHDLAFILVALAGLFIGLTGVVWIVADKRRSEGLAAAVLGVVLFAWACIEVLG